MSWIPTLLLNIDESKLLSLKQYERIAEKQIAYFFPKHPHLLNNDVIGTVVEYLIRADSKFEEGKGRTKWSLRNGYAKFAIMNYSNRKDGTSKKRIKTYSYDICIRDNIRQTFLKDIIPIKQKKSDEIASTLELLNYVFKNAGLTSLQKIYIELYYIDGLNYREIGEKYNCTRQNVENVLSRGIEMLQNFAKQLGSAA